MIAEATETRGRQETIPLADQTSYVRSWRGFKTKTLGTFNGLRVEGDTVVLTRRFVSPLYDEPMLGKPSSEIPTSVTLEGDTINAEKIISRSRFYRRKTLIFHR